MVEPQVIIKPLAYLKMLKHVLRFGSIAKKKSQFKECMGMLMGRLGPLKGTVHDVEVVDAIPMTHGGHIEVAFEDQDYVAFADINAKYAEEGVFNVGWYHSHPGLTMFLSTVDVRNHLGFQTTNASAIAIVWDHQFLEEEGNIGFDTFRLTELGKGQYSDYTSVQTIVEPPTTLDFYKLAIKDILDMQQAGNPAMLEVNELPNVLGDFDPAPVDEAKYTAPNFSSGINDTSAEINGASLSAGSLQAIAAYLNNWSKDISQALKNRGVLLNQNLSQLKESIEKGVKELQLWFLNDSYDELSKFWEKVDSALEKPIEARKPLLESIDQDFSVDDNNAELMVLSLDQLLDRVKTAREAYNQSIGK